MIKYLSQIWTKERWSMSVAWLTVKLTFTKARPRLWQRWCFYHMLIYTNLPICGSETWSRWNGGTISGWMSLLQHSWLIYAWKSLQEFLSSKINAGFNSCKNRSGVFKQTRNLRHIQFAVKLVTQMKPMQFLMVFHMERDPLSWSNYSTYLATTQWAKV
jgi:hypothetical protein